MVAAPFRVRDSERRLKGLLKKSFKKLFLHLLSVIPNGCQ